MAITFTQAAQQGLLPWEALKKGELITDFTYDMQEAPEIMQDMVYGYSDPLVSQFIFDASVGKGSTSSDQERWYEAGRIQNSYIGNVDAGAVSAAGVATLTFPNGENFDIKSGQTLMIGGNNNISEARVDSVDTTAKTAVVHFRVTAPDVGTTGLTVVHLASEYKQGSDIANETTSHTGIWRSNNPIILRDNMSYDRSKIKQIVSFSDSMNRYSIDDRAFDKTWEYAQVLAGVFGMKSAASTQLEADGLVGSESVVSAIESRGNTAVGSWADKSDLENYVKLLNSNKGSKTNMLLLDIDSAFDFDNALASISPNATSEYNFGAFDEGVDYRKLGFSGVNLLGWDTMYKTWDLLDDDTYLGAFTGNTSKITGMSIPKGQVQLASGGSIPYLQFLYRDGMPKTVAVTGTVVGNDHKDELRQTYTSEFTVRAASMKDFVKFT